MSKIITKTLANEEISKYLENEKQASLAFSTIVDVDSKKYYTTAPESFVFEKAQIEQLFSLNPTANGFKVYQASHTDGSPTIVLVACLIINAKATEDAELSNKTSVTNLIASDAEAALQFPAAHIIQNSGNFNIQMDNG